MTGGDRKTAVITGASTGIGRAFAVRLAREGWRVALLGRNKKGLTETEALVRQTGGDAEIFEVDLADSTNLLQVAVEIEDSFNAVNVLANIAGVWHNDELAYQGPLLQETPTDQILEVLRVGVEAPMLLTARLLPAIIRSSGGHVLNISGTFSSGAKGWLHYYVSKKAIEDFTIGLAQEMREHEITVNCVCPADVATEAYLRFYPEYAAGALRPEDVAEVMWEFIQPLNKHITGQVVEVRNIHDHG